jgi:hypothetical protein
VFADFLRKVWHDKIAFRKLNLPKPASVPIGPNAVIADDDRLRQARLSGSARYLKETPQIRRSARCAKAEGGQLSTIR